MKLETHGGEHISSVCQKAVQMADGHKEPVEFTFNDTVVVVQPGENAEAVEQRWGKDREEAYQKYINSQEYKDAEAKRDKEYADKCAVVMVEKAQTEAELRETGDPWPYTEKQLGEYVASLVNRSHDYGTCVYAMTLAAQAAFNYVAHKLGVTGFQASCADLSFLRRSRHIKGPFMIIMAEDALYPQSDPYEKLREALNKWAPWLKEEAKRKLVEANGQAAPRVLDFWKQLAGSK